MLRNVLLFQLAEYAADPLCRGIYAGDCRKLSVKSCFPDVFELEQKYGSLIRGALFMPRGKHDLYIMENVIMLK